MKHKLKTLSLAAGATLALTAMAGSMAADRVLNAGEVKKLITGNTAHVTRVHNGEQWNLYFAPDGKGYKTEGEASGTWEVKDNGEHCVSWSPKPKYACARVADIGDGKYARLKDDGSHLVIWKIEAGKKL